MEENPELIPGDYYSILNVPRFATTDEIRAAYKRLAVTYHPDRHSPESGLRTEAKEKFTLIKTAYETLIDDKLRALYDKYGAEGLKSGWELAARTKSTEEMLKEFEKLKKREEERLLDSRVHARSAITMSMSAADLIDSLTGKLNILEVTGMSLSQSVKFPFSERDQATLIGNVRHLNGNGVGSLTCKYNRSISPESTLFSELSSTGSVHAISIGMWRRLSPLWAAQLSSVLHSGGSGVTFTIDRTLSSNTAAQFTYQQGYNPYMSLVISSQQELYSITTDIRVNDDDTSAGLELTRVISKKAALKLGGRVNLNGDLEINIGGVRRMSKISKFSMFISVNPDAISLNLGFQRAGHKLSFPILVTREVTLQNIAGAMVVPSVLLLLLKYVIIDPQQKKRKKRKIEKLRKETADQRIAAKKAAESAIKLMMTNVQRKVLVEESRRGLIVVYACYGCLDENNKEAPVQDIVEGEERVIDVTIPLQYLVEDSQLHLHESSSKSHLLGFFDPCPGEEKKLYIKYLFKDKLHEVTMSDTEAIGLPLASHLIKYVN